VPNVPSIKLKRHCCELSQEKTNEVVQGLAELFVNFIKSRSELGVGEKRRPSRLVGNRQLSAPLHGTSRDDVCPR
jgi:hypothetical protein